MNLVKVSGNLTRDPELRYTGAGKAVCKAGLAVHQKKEYEAQPIFIELVTFGALAEQVAAYSKGRSIEGEGRLNYEAWTGKDGEKRSKVNVILFKCWEREKRQAPREEWATEAPFVVDNDDDIPF